MGSGLKRNIFARKWLNRHSGMVRVALGEDMGPSSRYAEIMANSPNKKLEITNINAGGVRPNCEIGQPLSSSFL